MISVIIPTLNRAASLHRTLGSLFSCDEVANNKEVEVIVIDNGSTDDTKRVSENFAERFSNFIYQYDDMPGLLTGRHKGAAIAKGNIFAFLDDDVDLSPGWLVSIREAYTRNPGVSFITGPCLPKYEVYPPGWLHHFWDTIPMGGKACGWLSLLDLGDREMVIDPLYVWGLNFSVTRNAFHELGGFHPDCIPARLQMYQGDGECGLTYKASNNGHKALYTPGAMVYHQIPKDRLTIEYFDKRAYYQGVCHSFTDIRTANGLYTEAKKNNEVDTASGLKKLVRSGRHRVSGLFSLLFRSQAGKEPGEIVSLKQRFREKEAEGYAFHQKAFNENHLVKEWVLRNDYFNYKLPVL